MIVVQKNSPLLRALFSLLAIFLFASLLMLETLSAETRYRVRSSDNVNTIVQREYPNSGLSKAQLLIGILIKNPRAFKGGNVNFLLRGRRLVLPDKSFFEQISPEKASEVLSEHVRYFQFGITGKLPAPTLAEIKKEPEGFNDPSGILEKQKSQTAKIDKLQQESDTLKKQLEILLNEKNNRDQRLIDLEKSLKNTLELEKKPSSSQDERSSKVVKKEALPVHVQQGFSGEKQNIQKAPNNPEVMDVQNDLASSSKKPILLEPTTNLFSKLFWVAPLILFGLLALYFVRKKKNSYQNDVVETNEAGYIETAESSFSNVQEDEYELEESSLETSVKLDVARAYIEAEDHESAVDILTEIMEEGSDEQRQQAHDLLDAISHR